jgi:hypothetical protein
MRAVFRQGRPVADHPRLHRLSTISDGEVIVIMGLSPLVPALGAASDHLSCRHLRLARFMFDDDVTLHFLHRMRSCSWWVAFLLVCGWLRPREEAWKFTRNEG